MTDQRITRTDHTPSPYVFGDTRLGPYIERQEAHGQQELLNSTDLPTDTNGTDQEFLNLGFTFGDPHSHDPLFRPANLPPGWTREGTEHAMHSQILDHQGRPRVSVFYKAAFYDRSATMSLIAPTTRLTALIWGDGKTTRVELDELLTAAVARDYLTRCLNNEREDLTLFPEGSATHRSRVERITRITQLLDSLPTD